MESAPQIETELRQGMSGAVLAQVGRGELDVGFYLGLPPVEEVHPALALARQSQSATNFIAKKLAHFTYRVLGRDWRALAALPWLATPPVSAHHRLLASVFGPNSLTGVEPKRVALVDQEASMLDLVKSGVGLSLVRDSIAIREAQARGLVVADRVSLECDLSFVCLKSRVDEPVVRAAWEALQRVWR